MSDSYDELKLAQRLRSLPPAPTDWIVAAQRVGPSEPRATREALLPDFVAHRLELVEAEVEPEPDLLERPMSELLERLADENETPGIGFAAGLATAMAASLVAMVARISRPRWEESGGTIAQAELLSSRASRMAGFNAEAYGDALDLLERPHDASAGELGRALGRVAEVPLQLTAVAADVASLARHAAQGGDPGVRADAEGAAALAAAASQAAARLVEVNLTVLEDDPRVAAARRLADAAAAEARAALATS